MTEEQYRKWSAPFRRHDGLRKTLLFYNKAATWGLAAAYFAALLVLAVRGEERLWGMIFVPAAAFFAVTLLRAAVNRARPYETLHIEPLLERKKTGKSFPSRHSFSAFAVAAVLFLLSPAAGIVAAVLAALLAATRVIAGVHYPSDVIVGALLGVLLVGGGLCLIESLL